MYFMGILVFSGGFKSLRFAIEGGFMKYSIYLLCSFKGDMNSSLCSLNVQIARKFLCLIFDDLFSFSFNNLV